MSSTPGIDSDPAQFPSLTAVIPRPFVSTVLWELLMG